MNSLNIFPPSVLESEKIRLSLIQQFIAQVYGWMTCGLLLTALVSWYTYRTPELLHFINSNHIIICFLIISQFTLVTFISGMINSITVRLATSLFMLYSALTGLTISSIFVIYTTSSIASTFLITSAMFGTMTLYGYTTKQDLSSLINILFMAIIGLMLASLINILLKSTILMWITTYAWILIFVGLTAYDTQKLKNLYRQLSLENYYQWSKYSIIGALSLYLDFINLFLMLLRVFNNRR